MNFDFKPINNQNIIPKKSTGFTTSAFL